MQELASQAAFLKNPAGQVCINLSDPAFVQSDTIVVDRDTLCVFAVFHEAAHFIGSLSRDMVGAFTGADHVLLSSPRGDGSIFQLSAPLCARGGTGCHCGEQKGRVQ